LNEERKGFSTGFLKVLAACSLLVSLLFLSLSNDRGLLRVPLFPSNSNQDYFRQKLYLFESYSQLSTDLKTLKIERVKLVSSADSWEYPLWAMNPGIKFANFNVRDTPILCLDTCTVKQFDGSYRHYDYGNGVALFVPRKSS
jgi:hypothetical protein